MNRAGDGSSQVSVGGGASELRVQEGPVQPPEADLVPDGAVAQHVVAVIEQPAGSWPSHPWWRNSYERI